MTPARISALVLAFGTTLGPAGAVAIGSAPARAADGEKPAGPRPDRPAALAQRFQTADQAELLLLLDELGRSEPEPRQAARAIGDLLAAGQTDAVTDHALPALGRLGARDARPSLLAHIRHRRAETRSRAYAALALLKDPTDASTIAEGLRDSAAEVRATSARALGELRASETAPLLLRALGRGVTEAAPALGKLGDAASVDEFGKYLGKQSLEIMLAGYTNYMQRDDLPEAVKLHIVAALEEISGGVVKSFLSDLLANKKMVRSQKLQRAIIATIARIKVEPTTGTTVESSP